MKLGDKIIISWRGELHEAVIISLQDGEISVYF